MHITLRMRLLCEVWREGQAEPQQTYEVMNEVVVDRGANPYLTKIECWEHDRLITKVRARHLLPPAHLHGRTQDNAMLAVSLGWCFAVVVISVLL